jgi:hypothetical protein
MYCIMGVFTVELPGGATKVLYCSQGGQVGGTAKYGFGYLVGPPSGLTPPPPRRATKWGCPIVLPCGSYEFTKYERAHTD